jgi:hypothetical protein
VPFPGVYLLDPLVRDPAGRLWHGRTLSEPRAWLPAYEVARAAVLLDGRVAEHGRAELVAGKAT